MAVEETDPNEELEIVNRYLTIYKELTEEGALSAELAEVSDRPEYVFQMTITTLDIDKVPTTITLYFNEVVIAEETEIDETIDDSGEEQIEEVPEDEEAESGHDYRHREEERNVDDSTILVGLVVTETEEFPVDGYRYVEEDVVRLGFRARLDDGRVLRIKHMSSDNVQRFDYMLRNQGTLIARKKVMIGIEDNVAFLKLEDNHDGIRERYSFKKETSEEGEYYKIKFDTPEGRGVIHIYITLDGEGNEVLEYFFSGGNTYHHNGEGNHHGEYDGERGGHGDGDGDHECPDEGDDDDYEEEFDDFD
jgi:hypothetical protein